MSFVDELMWRDAPERYGPPKTPYNRFIRCSKAGVADRIFAALASACNVTDTVMIDTTHLKAHRTAASLLKWGCSTLYRTRRGQLELQAPHGL